MVLENIQTSMLDSVPSLPPQPPLSAGMKMKAVSVERFLDGGRGQGSGEASARGFLRVCRDFIHCLAQNARG